jgi:hypothetical protein
MCHRFDPDSGHHFFAQFYKVLLDFRQLAQNLIAWRCWQVLARIGMKSGQSAPNLPLIGMTSDNPPGIVACRPLEIISQLLNFPPRFLAEANKSACTIHTRRAGAASDAAPAALAREIFARFGFERCARASP